MLITSEERRRRLLQDELWYRGQLRYLIARARPHAQLSIYDSVHRWQKEHPEDPGPLCYTTHRRLGKTHCMATLIAERALSMPGQVIKFGTDTYKHCLEIFQPVWHRVFRECPKALAPEKSGYIYTFKNPRWRDVHAISTVTLVGCNIENGDRLRGTDLDLGILDECRNINNLLYIQNDILWPQFLDRVLPLQIYTTTIPRTLAHDYIVEILSRAKADGRAWKWRVADLDRDPMTPPAPEENLDWKPKHERLVFSGGSGITKDSATWHREYLCEEVPDDEALIIPEFNKVKAQVVYGPGTAAGEDYTDKHPGRPQYFFPYMGADFGWDPDCTAVLHGFHDFRSDLLVIEREIVTFRSSPANIAELVKTREEALYPGAYHRRQIQRFSDNDPLVIASLTQDHGLWVSPAEKWDKETAIADLRTRMGAGKVRIHSSCKNLIYQLENGIWDEDRKSFIRSKMLGHCDAIDALIYLNRMMNYRANPEPVTGKPEDPNVFTPSWATPPQGSVTHTKTVSRNPTGRRSPFG